MQTRGASSLYEEAFLKKSKGALDELSVWWRAWLGRYRRLVTRNLIRRKEVLFSKFNQLAEIRGKNCVILCARWLQTNFTIDTGKVTIVMAMRCLRALNYKQEGTKQAWQQAPEEEKFACT